MTKSFEEVFSRSPSTTPVGVLKPLNRSVGFPIRSELINVPPPTLGGGLPPLEKRTEWEERFLRTVHRKDVEAYLSSRALSPARTASSEEGATKPWSPTLEPTECPDGCHVSTERSTSRHSSLLSLESLSDIDDEDLDADEDIRRLVDYVLEREANEAVERPEPETEEASDTSWLSRFRLRNEGETETEFDATRTGSRPETTRSRDRYIGFEPFEKYESEYWKTPDDHDGPISARVFSRDAEGDLRLGRFIEDDQALHGFKGGYTDTRRMLQVRGEAGTGDDSVMPAAAGVEVNVLESEAKAGVETTVNLEEGQATAAVRLGANLTVVEIKGDAEGTFIPARKIDALCEKYPWLGSNRFTQSLCEAVADDEYDMGVRLFGEAGGSVGLGASADGEARYQNGRVMLRGRAKGHAGVGATFGLGMEGGHFPR